MTISPEAFRHQAGRRLKDFYEQMRAEGDVPPCLDFNAAGL